MIGEEHTGQSSDGQKGKNSIGSGGFPLFSHQADEQHTKAVPQHSPQNIAYQIVYIGLSTTKDILEQLDHKRCADPGGQHPKPPSETLYRKRKQYAQWKEHGDVQQRV